MLKIAGHGLSLPAKVKSLRTPIEMKIMPTPASPLATHAEEIFLKQFARLREPTKYLAAFRTRTGRHIALTRQRKNDIYIWAECCPETMDGITVKNRDFPGQPYSTNQPRSSNLNNASKNLGLGNQAYYLKCDTLGAMEKFAQWYDGL